MRNSHITSSKVKFKIRKNKEGDNNSLSENSSSSNDNKEVNK